MKKVEAANMTWFVLGGLIIALEYIVASILLIVTVIGIPFAKETLRIGSLSSVPFGRRVYKRKSFGHPSYLLHVIWIVVGGAWITLSHLILGIAFGITIIGIPFAQKHFRLALVALTPYGVKILED